MQKAEILNKSKFSPITLYEEMSSSYLSYAMSVIVSRALPDVRDGLKPVHRRIIYAMYKGGFDWTKQFRKSARIVGDVIGKYHPHGDQAVYDALVRMVQDFSMSLPLVDGQGNFGSIDGDPPAAMRYTETRLSKVSQYLIDDIEKNTVAYKSNYDETEREPTVLPSQYPNLLVNGAGGIAVGMATSIPSHNLGEVIEATLALINNKEIKINELMKIIPGPDFPTGGIIIGKDIIKQGYNKGRGSFKIRGEIDTESLKNGKDRLIIKSIPYQVNKSSLNENSKIRAQHILLPELCHNEIQSWGKNPDNKITSIFLRDDNESPEQKERFESLSQLLIKMDITPLEIFTEGKTKLGRIINMIYLLDYVSLYLAILKNIDPTPTPNIDEIKKLLKKRFSNIY